MDPNEDAGPDDPNLWMQHHNFYRQRHSTPPLVWDPVAAQRARMLANQCVFEHSKGARYGENIALSARGIVKFHVDLWYAEINSYNYQNPVFSSAVGHFTAMMWVSATGLGCARTFCPNHQQYLSFCLYAPASNVDVRVPGVLQREVRPPNM
jgi:uncharacterized protein YkwD